MSDFKFGLLHLKTFVMLNCEAFEFSLHGVAVARRRTSMFRHTKSISYNSTPHDWIFSKFYACDHIPGLKTSTGQFCIIVTAPPTGNRTSAFCDNSHPIYMKFTWCGLHMIYIRMMYNYWVFSSHTWWTQEGASIYYMQCPIFVKMYIFT